ncbi:MAG: hypothetical protein A2Z95_06280 [Gallionellales bacterium GWA2_60_18]|nr:MAG: hypothetical protein A2Z95_06280 [Gallionellales bacterium GWA2_60_18]
MDNRIWESGAGAAPPAAPAAPSAGYPSPGDPLTATPASKGGPYWYHQIGEELRAVIAAAGITPDHEDLGQLYEAIQRLIDAQSGNYSLDTGAADAYVVALDPPITAYSDGMTVRVKAITANNGASTLNAGGGAAALVSDVGGALVAGDVPAGGIFTATYIESAGKFYITAMVQSQGDARYALAGSVTANNIIINGGFAVNQRAYVSAATLAAGAYGHDRWKAGSGGGDYSFAQLAANTTITIAANKTLIQVVEDKNVHATRYVVSWAGTALARAGVNSATPSGSYAASPLVITGQTPGTVMSIEFGNGASAGTLGSVQIEASESAATASAFAIRPYGMELEMCFRYYEAGRAANYTGTSGGTGLLAASNYFKARKRVVPTCVVRDFAGTAGKCTLVTGVTGATTNNYACSDTATDNNRIVFSTPVGAQTQYGILYDWTADAEL